MCLYSLVCPVISFQKLSSIFTIFDRDPYFRDVLSDSSCLFLVPKMPTHIMEVKSKGDFSLPQK
jgi:hypothetical protein